MNRPNARLQSEAEASESESSSDDLPLPLYRFRRGRDRTWVKMMMGITLVLLIAFVTYDSMNGKRIEHIAHQFFGWVEHHPFLGVAAVVMVYIIATICFVPGSLLTIGTGFAFRSAFDSFGKGLAFASLSVFLGASLGSILCFLLGRYLFRDWVLELAAQYPLFQAIDRALEGNGLKIMVLLRLSPLIPYNALDYISGVTSISLLHYSLALLGILPGTIMFCAIGATTSSITDGTNQAENGKLGFVAMVFGIVFALLGASAAGYYSKVELDKLILQEEQGPILLQDMEESPRHDSGSNASIEEFS